MTVYCPHPGEEDLPDPLEVISENLAAMRRMCAKPMKSYDSGSVVDANWIDELAEEAELALSRYRQENRDERDPTIGTSWSES